MKLVAHQTKDVHLPVCSCGRFAERFHALTIVIVENNVLATISTAQEVRTPILDSQWPWHPALPTGLDHTSDP